MSKKHLKLAHHNENIIVDQFWRKGYPAIRIPISGAGRFKGDVLAFGNHVIYLRLVRRTDDEKVVLRKKEVKEVMDLANKISQLIYPISVEVGYDVHFAKKRKWVSGTLSYQWDGKDVVVKCK